MNREPLLRVRGISMSYPRQAQPALDDVALDVGWGELVGVSGPSGSGKTSLLMVLLGWERSHSGTINWAGESRDHLGALGWDDVTVVPQRLGLANELTLRENIELPLVFAHKPDLEPAQELIEGLQLSEVAERRPGEASVGEQQRAAIARALVTSPKLLIADEPTGHQDGSRKTKILEHWRCYAREGTAVLMATHDAEALAGCDRIVHLRSGSVVDEQDR